MITVIFTVDTKTHEKLLEPDFLLLAPPKVLWLAERAQKAAKDAPFLLPDNWELRISFNEDEIIQVTKFFIVGTCLAIFDKKKPDILVCFAEFLCREFLKVDSRVKELLCPSNTADVATTIMRRLDPTLPGLN